MSEHSKRIVRQWKREVEDEVRRESQRRDAAQPWRAVVYSALWLLWLVLLAGLLTHARVLQ